MMLRAYAFVGRKPKYLILLGFFYFVFFAIDIWVFFSPVEFPPPEFYAMIGDTACFPDYNTPEMHLKVGVRCSH